MTSKEVLRGAFNSLGDSMVRQFDPSDPEEVHSALMGAMSAHASQARRISHWTALARNCDAYRDTIDALVEATNMVAADGSHDELLTALGRARAAVDQVRQVLDTNPCATQTV